MHMMTRIVKIVVLMGTVVMSFNSAYACLGGASFEDGRKASDVIFMGEYLGCFTEDKESFIKYDVHKIWKGDVKETYTRLAKQCDKKIDNKLIGRKYLIYSSYKDTSSRHLNGDYNFCRKTRSAQLLTRWESFVDNIRSNWGLVMHSIRTETKFLGFRYFKNYDIEKLGTPIHTFGK